ncbi:MAG: helix-turn-helix transcriptional regulator [Planctomycetes bacterium]|nr:helix-turn-helix transcriptional regulator [Planctomycetota bacterium]
MATCTHIGLVAAPTTFHPSHQHEVWELVLYTSGTGEITVGSQAVPFRPGTIVCLPPRIPHVERSPRGYTNIHLVFSDFTPPVAGIPIFADDPDRSFFHLAMQLHREFHLKRGHWRLICEGLADLLVRYLERWAAPPSQPPLVDRLERMLIERLHESDFSVGEALRALGCTPDHARRVFIKARGRTPLDHLTELRIGHAKHLLATGARVREVAESVGLPDPYYFSRVFRRVTGRSPTHWLAHGRDRALLPAAPGRRVRASAVGGWSGRSGRRRRLDR